MENKRIGIWLIGVKGGVASTTVVGLLALQCQKCRPIGLITELPPFAELPIPAWNDLVVGGHEIRRVSLVDAAEKLVSESRTVEPDLFESLREQLAEIDARIRPGLLHRSGDAIRALADWDLPADATPADAVARVVDDLRYFQTSEGLDHVVVVNVSSTEPWVDPATLPETWDELRPMLDEEDCPLPASSLYAVAAFTAGCSFINFTPSLGSLPEAIRELASREKVCHAGRDGKTGETLMKSVLAPMFARRNLEVMSWVGHNIFGNMDGQILNDPANKATKVTSKDRLLGDILGYQPQTLISIEWIKSMGDWKTAWDHIHFRGFLGAAMTLQFTWQGCDSILAAPLVLDMVRLTEAARRRGCTGALDFLASFFKSPMEADASDASQPAVPAAFDEQFRILTEWATNRQFNENNTE